MLRHAVIEVDVSSVEVHPVISDALKNDLTQTLKRLHYLIRNLPSCRKHHMSRCADTSVTQSSRTRPSRSSGEDIPVSSTCSRLQSRTR